MHGKCVNCERKLGDEKVISGAIKEVLSLRDEKNKFAENIKICTEKGDTFIEEVTGVLVRDTRFFCRKKSLSSRQ